jgi:hypothetical protein
MRWPAAFALSALLLTATAQAQSTTESSLKVYLITIGPGAEPYEKFGHNMIWIHDPSQRFDAAYNWGLFDFAQENFIWRFIQGRMEYWMDAFDPAILDEYKKKDRSIWVQELNLTVPQIQSLLARVELNRLPQYSHYKYDYYLDNCSTRVRDALDGVIAGQIKSQLQSIPTNTTFRWHTRRLTQDDWWLYVALNYAMGHPVDRPISAWEECFLPVQMMKRLRAATIKDDAGRTMPLVAKEWQAYASTKYIEKDQPPNWIAVFLAIGVVLGAAMAMCARGSNRITRLCFAILPVVWSLLAGLGGAISTWAWLFTDHKVARNNENCLQLSPISLALVILIPAMFLRKKWGAPRVAILIAAMSVAGFLMQILPMMNQVNGEIIALALPIHVGLAYGVWSASQLIAHRSSSRTINERHIPSNPQRAP